MPKKVELSLIPAPGARPEFLAVVESLDDVSEWSRLPSRIVLEGYTRDAWAWKPGPAAPAAAAWTQVVCVSVDGRNKLPGFVKYLKERQKSCYGRFGPTAVFCVSYIQTGASSSDNEMKVRLCFDMTKLENCPLIEKKPAAAAAAPRQAAPPQPEKARAASNKKSGILGNLLGAQTRTNRHMAKSAKPVSKAAAASTANVRTAQQVLSEFREKMEQEMMDFDAAEGEVELKIKIVLSEKIKGLSEGDKARVTMDVLKYIVYEAAEECNEEWIPYKEPSEFMDECTVAVYKEGHAPEDVLEEVNRVEMTEEMRGEQRALAEANKRKQTSSEAKIDQERFQQALKEQQAEEEAFAALNTNKRDRRTIEEIQLGLPPEKKIKT